MSEKKRLRWGGACTPDGVPIEAGSECTIEGRNLGRKEKKLFGNSSYFIFLAGMFPSFSVLRAPYLARVIWL